MLQRDVTNPLTKEVGPGFRKVNDVYLNVTNKDTSYFNVLGFLSEESYEIWGSVIGEENVRVNPELYDQYFWWEVLAKKSLIEQIELYCVNESGKFN